MKEMCRLLSLKQLVTTLYHPICNGLIEKFNGTLRELMTSEKVEPEVKTTYEYLLDLKKRLQSTCQLAQIEPQKSQIRQRKPYVRKTKVRTFEKEDGVLVLLPTDTNKLLLQWTG